MILQHLRDHGVGIGHAPAVGRFVDLLDGGVFRRGRLGPGLRERGQAQCQGKGEGEGGEHSLEHEIFPVRSCAGG